MKGSRRLGFLALIGSADIDQGGGLERYNAALLWTIEQLVNELGPVTIMVRHPLPIRSGDLPSGIAVRSFNGHKFRFLVAILVALVVQRPEVTFAGLVNYAPLAFFAKFLKLTAGYVVQVHGIEAWSRLPPLRRHALRNADELWSVSTVTKSRVSDANGVALAKIRIIHPPLSWPVPEAPPPPPPTSPPEFLTVARLDAAEAYKGVDYVLRSLAQMKHIPWKYTVIGEGSDRRRLMDLTAELELEGRVLFLGRVNMPELHAAYARCAALVMPSSGEGFGITFLEAMSYAKPCIGAEGSGSMDLLRDGVNGYLTRPGDLAQLTAKLSMLALDFQLRTDMGLKARHLVLSQFTREAFEAAVTTALRSLLNNVGRDPRTDEIDLP